MCPLKRVKSSCLARPCHHAVDNHPAGVSHRLSLIAMSHAAFAKSLPARPPRLKVSRPPLVRLRYGLVTRRHPFDGVVGRLQNHGFPTDPATQATGLRLLPRWDCLPQNAPAFAGRTTTAAKRMSRKLISSRSPKLTRAWSSPAAASACPPFSKVLRPIRL